MEAMVDHGKENTKSLKWSERIYEVKKEKNLEAKSMGHVKIIANQLSSSFFLQNSSGSHANHSSSQMCKDNLSQKLHKWLLVSAIHARLNSNNSGDLLGFTSVRSCHYSVAAAPLMAPYDLQGFTLADKVQWIHGTTFPLNIGRRNTWWK